MDAPLPPQPTNTSAICGGSISKLRLMCSYGGHIIPRPQTKSLFYAGGDTRIVTVSTAATSLTLSSLTSHLAATLHVHYPFTLKYQLPCQDLDSLISLSTDEDLQIMLEEHDRLSSSHPSSRIRLFLFPTKPPPCLPEESRQQKAEDGGWFRSKLEQDQPMLQHPRTESWFVDALRSTGIMQKGGMEGQIEGNNGGGHESIFLETSSSFGSTSSSVSLSNLPPIKANSEDSVANLVDNKPKLPSPESVASETSVATAISQAETRVYMDQIMSVPAVDRKICTNPFETETNLPDNLYGTQMKMNMPIPASGYTISSFPDQPQPQQVQFVPSGSHYLPQNPPGLLPGAYYYPVYPPLPQQQPQFHFQPPRPYRVCYIPVGQSQPYNFHVQCGLADASNIPSGQASVHPNVSFNATPHIPLKEVALMPELASQTFQTAQAANPLVHVPCNEHGQQSFVRQQIHVQPQNISLAPREAVNYSNELKVDDDTVRAQIYKTQPPPPVLPSQYQTMAKAPAAVLSETLAQLHMDNVQGQIKPQ